MHAQSVDDEYPPFYILGMLFGSNAGRIPNNVLLQMNGQPLLQMTNAYLLQMES